MAPGFKYHVVTIAGIFFALAIGLVVGSLFVSPRLAGHQERLIEELRVAQKRDAAGIKQKNDEYQRFIAAVMPSLLRGKLAGAPVAIIQTGDYPEAADAVRAALLAADARVLSVTTIEKAFDRPDDLLNPALAALRAADPRFPTDRGGLAETIASILAHGDAQTDGFMPILEREGFIRTEENNDYRSPARYVVIVAGSARVTSHPANVDKPLIAALLAENLKVVACEPQSRVNSDLLAYKSLNLDLPVVPDVDTDLGRFNLIAALRGDKSADEQNADNPEQTP